MKKFSTLLLLGALALTSCTDAARSKIGALGDPANIKCYSADVVIYDGRSTGKVSNPDGSDGYQFKDAKTGWLTEVSGNCVVTYGTAK